jgi:adenine specific DNA methylase Mod
MSSSKEKGFYQALESIFTGANIEGESGYVNLLKIKSSYYKLILKKFKKDVDNEEIITDSFKEEFFDKLYSFFEKYFSESGSVYFVKTANWQRVYEQVYTDNKDVVLFWKTHMLYYVKSDILFQSIDVSITDEESKQEYNFYFDVGDLQAKQNNEKKALVFTFREFKEEKDSVDVINERQSKKTFVFDVAYSENGKKTKIDDLIKETKILEAILEKAFKTFKKQSEVDFFINKNAEKFLTEQLDMYLHQILLNEENKFDQKRLDQLKTIKTFALKIIQFIAQFEDELVRVWNKPKFALDSNYVVTLDKLTDDLIGKLAKHKNLPEQIKEWQELGMVGEDFDFAQIKKADLLGSKDEKFQFLPVDTKYFKDIEIEILSLFDNIDEALDGRLIHSENYQALNTLQEKYKEKVQCIYIDPPFNLEKNADFDYKVNYKNANWATLLENRLRLAHKLLSDTGSIFVRCDYNGNYIVRCLLDEIFGKENFKNEIILKNLNTQGATMTKFNPSTESLFLYSKNYQLNTFNYQYSVRSKKRKWINMHSPRQNKIENSYIEIDGRKFIAPKGRHWTFTQERAIELLQQNRLRISENTNYEDVFGNVQKGVPQYLPSEKQIIDSDWTDITGYSSTTGFSTENAEVLLQRVIQATTQENDLVLDFFAGSSTTQAVAQKLGRKWLGVEMGDQFFDVDLPRLKQVIFGKQSGISKDLKEKYKGGGMFKYEDLEQYEDTLRNMKYKDNSPGSIFDTRKAFEQYIFYADQKFAHVLEVNTNPQNSANFDPLKRGNGLEIDFDKLYPNIDFAETISNLQGLPIKRITKTSVILQDGEEEKEIKTDYKNMNESEKLAFIKLLKPALWWGQ